MSVVKEYESDFEAVRWIQYKEKVASNGTIAKAIFCFNDEMDPWPRSILMDIVCGEEKLTVRLLRTRYNDYVSEMNSPVRVSAELLRGVTSMCLKGQWVEGLNSYEWIAPLMPK